MKRLLCLALTVILLAVCFLPTGVLAAGSAPTRIIHVVYDDSGSMYSGDTWCRAKYSMEVFSAMLGKNDKMNVYYMSSYVSSMTASPKIELDGADGAAVNVAKIHKQKTTANNTPFNAVRKAYADLAEMTADEKWLVVLTDGEFEDGRMKPEDIDSFFAEKSDDVKVMFLGMGRNAAGITENKADNIFYVGAATNQEILSEITGICNRVFNSNRLEVGGDLKSVSFDVPMSQLIVFAQGPDVQINGIKPKGGTRITPGSEPVEVKYSECDATNHNNSPVKDLMGKIAYFDGDFDAGKYTLDITGAETVEVYYKPNVSVAAYLTGSDGKTVSDNSDIIAGEYTLTFGLVRGGTADPVPESKLLGEVTYEASVSNDGKSLGSSFKSGDKLQVADGGLSIDVTARYLDYNYVSSSLSFGVVHDKGVTFSVIEDPEFVVGSEGFREEGAIRIEAKLEGRDFTAEEWSAFEVPEVELTDKMVDFKLGLTIAKTSQPGILLLTPELPDGMPSSGTYRNVNYTVSVHQPQGVVVWSGEGNGIVKMQDERPWWERNWENAVRLVIGLGILFVLAGYLPCFKAYLPKSLKKKPYIKCVSSVPGEKSKNRNGLVEKSFISTIIPYVPQKGKIKYIPKGVTGCPVMAVRAIKGRRMTVTNVKAFWDKDYIAFDGESIKKDTKKYETGAGVCIRTKRGQWTYTCSPNQSN